jgi:glutaredoxin
MAKDIILKLGTYMTTVSNKDIAQGAIPGASLEKFVVNLLQSPTCCAKYVTLTKGAVTQAGSITTAVTLNQPSGEISTVSLTTAANTTAGQFTVTNNYVKADSVILASVNDYTGSTGFPVIFIDDIVAGSFKITVRNVDGSAFNGVVTIGFAIM